MKINLPRNPTACQTLVKAKIQNACILCICVSCIYIYIYICIILRIAYVCIYRDMCITYVNVYESDEDLGLNFQNCKHSKQILTDLLMNLVRHEHLEVHSGKHSQETD